MDISEKEHFAIVRPLEIIINELQENDLKLMARIRQLEEILSSYRIQTRAAMKTQSLGLCKKVISHAFTDEKKILEKKNDKSR